MNNRAAVESLESRVLMSVSLLASKANASEAHPTSSGRGVFTFSRTGSKAEALTVDFTVVSPQTTAAAADYQSLPTSVTIPAGKPSTSLTIEPAADGFGGAFETLELALSDNAAYSINPARSTAAVKIAVPHAKVKGGDPVSIVANQPSASETNPSVTAEGQFTVSRSGSTKLPLTVNYLLDPASTAQSAIDFTPLAGSVTIAAGSKSATIDVTPIVTQTHRPARTVVLDLATGAYNVNLAKPSATVTITDGNPAETAAWFDTADAYRTALTIDSGDYARTDEPVSQSINFSQLLAAQGASGSLIDASIEVVETSADGSTVLASNVPFQFDHGANYDAANNAAGTLTILASGNTPANTTRYYQIYFNTAGTYTPFNFMPQITVNASATDPSGAPAIEVITPAATYYVQTASGAISSIIDNQGNDWIGYNDQGGPGGDYRGMPDMGAYFHPGDSNATVAVDSTGPLTAAITASSTDGNYSLTYQFYPQFMQATVTKAAGAYWFLYEGTPGGQFNPDDTWTLSDGTTGTLAEEMPETTTQGGGTGIAIGAPPSTDGEWAYFDSASAGKYIYLAHNEPDDLIDSYYNINEQMTVFGFGKSRIDGEDGNPLMTAVPNTFTIGIADDTGAFSTNAATIDGEYQAMGTIVGTLQTQAGS
jgi:hypothetical protein